MGTARWTLFAAGWFAVIGSGFLAPRTFLGLFALGLDAVAFGCFLASFSAASRSGGHVVRHMVAWVAVVCGAVAVPLVADLGVGGSFHGPGAQPPDIRRFPTFAGAFRHVFTDPSLVALAAVAPLGLAAGWWVGLRKPWEAAGCYLLCLAAYPAIVFLLVAL